MKIEEMLNKEQLLVYNYAKLLKEKNSVFQYIEDESFNGRFFTINGKKYLHFANCSYMGLEKNPMLIEESIKALRNYGTQTSNSRGTISLPLYKKIEDLLPEIFPGNHVITKTVTLGHFSVLPLLIQENDAIIIDAYVHNSIRMASETCRAKGTLILPSKHNDMDHVQYLIKRLKSEGKNRIWYCADSIYSMHGDFIDIAGLENLLNKEERFFAYIDDAHGTGWYGKKGCGYVFENMNIHPKMIVIESFAKSFASCGGVVVVKNKDISDVIRMTGQTMLFSGPLQPSVLGAIIGSIKVHLSSEFTSMQNELIKLIQHFRTTCLKLEIPIISSFESPIQLIKIGDVHKTIQVLKKLLEKGFFTTSAVYPAVAEGDSGIRVSLTRHLKNKDIENFLLEVSKIITELK